jgi:hypothetical protein
VCVVFVPGLFPCLSLHISSFPAGGIKLHLELSLLLGTAAGACLEAAAAFYHLAWPLLGPSALTATAAAAAVGGASWGCAAAADVLLVVLGPLVVVYVLTAHLQQLHLKCMSATWRLIRGKQKVGADSSLVSRALLRA